MSVISVAVVVWFRVDPSTNAIPVGFMFSLFNGRSTDVKEARYLCSTTDTQKDDFYRSERSQTTTNNIYQLPSTHFSLTFQFVSDSLYHNIIIDYILIVYHAYIRFIIQRR